MVAEWRTARFGELLSGPVRNGIYKRKEYHGRGTKIVNMGELFAYPRLHAIPMKRVELSSSEVHRFALSQGDLLFARRSLVAEGAGKCSVVLETDEPTAFESSIIRARPDKAKAASLYLYYFFNSPFGRHLLDTIRRQVAVAGITGTDLSRLAIPVPPLAEQRAVARILGTLDDKIELNRRMSGTLEAIARAIFKSWFVDFDPVRAKAEGRDPGLPKPLADLLPNRFEESEVGEVPHGWKASRLSNAIDVNPRRSLAKGEIATYLDMANMPTTGHRAIQVVQRPFGSGSRFSNGDTLLARITPCLENGKTAFVDFLREGETGWGSTEYIVLRPKPPLPPEFGYYMARGEKFRAHVIQNMTGTSGRQRAPASCLDQYSIAVPPPELADTFASLARSMMARIRSNGDEALTLAALRDTLLPKLVSGELRISDPDRFLREVVP